MKRFYDKVEKTSTCWLWIGGSRGSGYGAFKYKGKVVDAHRISWQLNFGVIPKGLLICHKCDVRKCVNPKHLFLGTYSDNMRDAHNKGRLKISNRALKTPKEIKRVKEAILNRKSSLIALSKEIKISYNVIKKIHQNKMYID